MRSTLPSRSPTAGVDLAQGDAQASHGSSVRRPAAVHDAAEARPPMARSTSWAGRARRGGRAVAPTRAAVRRRRLAAPDAAGRRAALAADAERLARRPRRPGRWPPAAASPGCWRRDPAPLDVLGDLDAAPAPTGPDAPADRRRAGPLEATASSCASPPATWPASTTSRRRPPALADLADDVLRVGRSALAGADEPGRDRHGQARRPRAQLRQRHRRDVRGRATSARPGRSMDVARRCFRVDANLRPEGRDGPLVRSARRLRGLLGPLGRAVGVPGAAQGPAGGRRPRARAGRWPTAAGDRVWGRPFGADDAALAAGHEGAGRGRGRPAGTAASGR